MSGAIGHNKTVLLYEASMTPANSRAYDGVCRYAEQAGWIVPGIHMVFSVAGGA